MNLLTIILFGILLWIIYSLLESYNSLSRELKEIKNKCNIEYNNKSDYNEKISNLKDNLLYGLNRLLNI
jgi:hypothetical protein